MRRILGIATLILGSAFLGSWLGQAVHAQGTASNPLAITVSGLHAACPTPPAASTPPTSTYCLTSEGLWVSQNGAAYAVLNGAPSGGVLSFNGQTGAVVYAAPVLSVNGKTGAVVVTATTSLN